MNPTTVRLSDTLLLSDCVGCDSVYRYGYANPVTWGKRSTEMKQAKKLAALMDRLHEDHGPYSVSYGYIHPELSRRIVKYQNPDKPSYHRWDHGAALDVCFHQMIHQAPVYTARDIDTTHDYSRMITYSESEWICVGTRTEETSAARKAFYENRFEGDRKPRFVKYSDNPASRERQKAEKVPSNWKGAGYPTYHGGGRKQFQHQRLGRYTVLSDLLYKARYVHEGRKNLPPLTNKAKMKSFLKTAERFASILDMIVTETGNRLSVVSGYDHKKCWSQEEAYIEVVPHMADAHYIADLVCGNALRAEYRKTKNDIERVKIYVE